MADSNGLLYDGSPIKMPSRELYHTARFEGKSVMKGKELTVYESPSPNSKLISHSSSSVAAALGELASEKDIDGVLRKLEKPQLTPVESLVNLLAGQINDLKKAHHDLKKAHHDLKKAHHDLQVGQEILKIGTSPLVLSFECLKQVESSIGPFYNKGISKVQGSILGDFGTVVKAFQKSQPDPFISRSTGDVDKVCLKIDIGTFGAALYHFVKHYSLYNKGNFAYTKESAKTLASPLLQSYSDIMKKFVLSLPNATNAMVDAAANPTNIKEWYAFYQRRMQRDHKGGHCAAWRDGYPDEAARLVYVTDLFSQMVETKMPELEEFPFLKHCVVPTMGIYIERRQAQESKKRSAADISSDESDAILCEWGSA